MNSPNEIEEMFTAMESTAVDLDNDNFTYRAEQIRLALQTLRDQAAQIEKLRTLPHHDDCMGWSYNWTPPVLSADFDEQRCNCPLSGINND